MKGSALERHLDRRDDDLLDVPALAQLRSEIDRIDADLVKLLRQRLDVVERVLKVKQADAIPANIPARVEQVVERVRAEADRAGLPPALAETLWRQLIAWTIAYEETRLRDEDGRA